MKLEEAPAASTQCDRANFFMMKYMDGELNEKDAQRLREHMVECPACKADFMLYDFILESLTEKAGLIAPDEGFTLRVMSCVASLPSQKKVAEAFRSRFTRGLLIAFSVLFGLAFVLVVYQEQIMGYLSGVTGLSGYIAAITPVTERIFLAADGVIKAIGDTFIAALDFLSGYRYLFFGVFIALVGSQLLIVHYRDKSKVRGRVTTTSKK